MINKCPKCSSSFTEKNKFCKICGCNLQEELIERPTCPKCKTVFSSDIKFCVQDGTKLVHPDMMIPKCIICKKAYTNGTKFCPNDGGEIKLDNEIIKEFETIQTPVTEVVKNNFKEQPLTQSPSASRYTMPETYDNAPIGRRFLAYLLDGFITLLFFIPSLILIVDYFMEFYTYGSIDMISYDSSKIIFGVILLVLPFCYSLIKDGLGNGQSYGKRALDLMVINVRSNNPCSKTNSAGRNIMFSLFCSIPYIGYLVEVIMVFANPEGRKLSDLVAGTQVIDARKYQHN